MRLPYSVKVLIMCWDNFLIAVILLILLKLFFQRYMVDGLIFSAFFLVGSYIFKYKVYKPAMKRESLPSGDIIGSVGYAVTSISPIGVIRVKGEEWTAIARESIEAGSTVIVEDIDGLKLRVRKADS